MSALNVKEALISMLTSVVRLLLSCLRRRSCLSPVSRATLLINPYGSFVDSATSPSTTSPVPAATIRTIEFRANGMYDPDVRVGGHQPYGFDQIMLGYGKFTVVKASMTVENLNAIYGNNVSLVPAVYVESEQWELRMQLQDQTECVRCRLPAMSFSWTVMQPTLLVIREVPLCGLILLRFWEKKLGILSEMIGSVDRICRSYSAGLFWNRLIFPHCGR